MARLTTQQILLNAWHARTAVPALNVPYLPMMAPIVRALRDTGSFGLIQVARPEWEKFQAGSLQAIRAEYEKVKDDAYTRLHLDHVPVIDEDGLTVDFEKILAEAIELGYESLMVDGSRLSLDGNIAATAKAARLAHDAGLPIEGELGAVMGHEAGPLPPYEELFANGMGFTDPAEAARFVADTGVDWLSVAIGNIHGAISGVAASKEKIAARLNVDHLDRIGAVATVPLVLHGGSGVQKDSVLAAISHGIAKINIGTVVRKVYEKGLAVSQQQGQDMVYDKVVDLLANEIRVAGSAAVVNPAS